MRKLQGILLLIALIAAAAVVLTVRGDAVFDDDDAAERGRANDDGPRNPATLAGAPPRDRRTDSRARTPTTRESPRVTSRAGETLAQHARLVDARGRPVAGATVRVWDDETLVATARTDEEGRLGVDAPSGRYLLLIQAPDGSIHARSVRLHGTATEAIPLRLARSEPLQLRVTERGEPFADVRIRVTPAGIGRLAPDDLDAPTVAAATTGRAGEALVDALALGTYDLALELAGGGTTRVRHEHRSGVLTEIAVPPRATLRGTITDGAEGPGVDGALVHVTTSRSGDSAFRATSRTQADGRFEMPVAEGTTIGLVVEAEGFAPWPPVGEGRELYRARQKIIAPLQALHHGRDAEVAVPLTRFPGPALSGRVLDRVGSPVAGVEVILSPNLSGRRRSVIARATTDENGRFEIERMRSGAYVTWVRGEAWVWRRSPLKPNRVTIPPYQDETVDMEIAVTPARRIIGTVTTADGQPAAGARVWLGSTSSWRFEQRHPDEPARYETSADAAGRFVLTGLDLGKGTARMLRAASGREQADPLEVRLGDEETDAGTLVIRPAVTLHGRVVERGSGRSVPGVLVLVEPARGEPAGRRKFHVTCDVQGRYEIRSLLPSKWRLQPRGPDHLRASWSEHDFTEKSGAQVLDLELDPGLAIAGVVLDEEKRPLAAKVRVTGYGKGLGRWSRELRTDAQGRFRATGMLEGRFGVSASAPGHDPGFATNLRGGEEHLEIILKPRK